MEETKLTAKDIFVQIAALQRQLTESSNTSLHRLGDAISSLESDSSENEDRWEQIADICDVFKTRELTLLKMLELYERMYNDIQKEKANEQKIEPAQ